MESQEMAKKAAPPGPAAPPLEPLARTLARVVGKSVLGFNVGLAGDPVANFRLFAETKIVDLGPRPLGNWSHLTALYSNVLAADVQEVARAIDAAGGNAEANERANAAGVNLMMASNVMHSAITLHLHPVRWNDRAALILARVALEAAGRAALIGNGSADEVHRCVNGPQPTARACIDALATQLNKVSSTHADVGKVYGWLCNFGHMNHTGAAHFANDPHGVNEDAYAGLAYVAWCMGVVAELVVGVPSGVTYPAVLPAKLPWD